MYELPHYVVDKWKLQISNGIVDGDKVSFNVLGSYIPLRVIPVLKTGFTSKANGVLIGYRDLSQVLNNSDTIDITWMGLIMFDVSDFMINPGVFEYDVTGFVDIANYDFLLLHLIEL